MKRIKKKIIKPVTLDQWIEITRENGKTVSTLYPPNKELERLRQEMDPPAVLVYRRLNFVHGVPAEYDWTQPTDGARHLGGMFLQRLSIENWLHTMELERTLCSPHVIFADASERRPPEFGPCPCARCTSDRKNFNE